jgi:hypothetical protein
MRLGSGSIKVGFLALMLVAFCSISSSVAASSGAVAGGRDGSFCGRPTIHVQVVSSPLRVRLGLSRKSIQPGGDLRIRIENLGAHDVVYGLAYEMARFDKGIWVKLPTGPFFAPRFVVPAGTASSCQKINIPSTAPPGVYRIRKEADQSGASPPRSVRVAATFRVR